ncbi:MAG: hypothetical protein ACI8QC_000822 [Planctomycetota bacterium]|jgi:hypothetical protein
MNRAFQSTQPGNSPEREDTLFGVATDALEPILHGTLQELRSALSQLGSSLDEDPERSFLLGRALEHLEDADRCADAVAELAVPSSLNQSTSSVRELAQAAWSHLSEELRRRVWIAPDEDSEEIFTDVELLAQNLACLLGEVVSTSKSEVLLHAHASEGVAYFSIVESESRQPEDAPLSCISLLARRDLERLGAEMAVRLTDPRHRCIVVRLPLAPKERAA